MLEYAYLRHDLVLYWLYGYRSVWIFFSFSMFFKVSHFKVSFSFSKEKMLEYATLPRPESTFED